MKILFISMPSIHAIRWIENLKDTSHELYWFDIMERGNILTEDISNLEKIISWKKRKIKYIKGEYWLSKNKSIFYSKIQPFMEVTINEELTNIINDIRPNIIHSFEMQNCSYPILKTLQKFPKIKWIYSCWGSDLFYYQNFKNHRKKIKSVLKRINYIHTDCLRDYTIAKQLGFKGGYSGVIPGGTGYDLNQLSKFKHPINSRNVILVKGYEHTFGRAINVLKALKILEKEIINYEVIVFGAHLKTIDYIKENNLEFKYYDKDTLDHTQILKLMGKSKLYIGNSISDGMPNTLIEAIILNAFPIQSNPGNVTSEIIENGINGLLINDPEDVNEIKTVIEKALAIDGEMKFENAAKINSDIASNRLDFTINKQKIIDLYANMQSQIDY